MGRKDVPYRIAALASFTSYPIAHGLGAVALISPVIRYRIYSSNGLGAIGVANICFLTGLTFWLGNMTALGFSLLVRAGRHQRHRSSLALDQPAAGAGPADRRRRHSWYGAGCIRGRSARADGWSGFRPVRWCWCRSWSGCSISRRRRVAMYVLLPAGLDIGCLPPDRRLHRRDAAGLREPCAGGTGRVRCDHPDRTGRGEPRAIARGAVDVPLSLSPRAAVRSRSRLFGGVEAVAKSARESAAADARKLRPAS